MKDTDILLWSSKLLMTLDLGVPSLLHTLISAKMVLALMMRHGLQLAQFRNRHGHFELIANFSDHLQLHCPF